MKLSVAQREWILAVLAIGLGLFFVYAGGKKLFLPPAPRPDGPSAVPQEFIDLIRALKAAGPYMTMVGLVQFISGLMLLVRPTRLIGALMLLPVTFNIFAIHLMLDDRVGEFVFTGFLLVVNGAVVLAYLGRLWLGGRFAQRSTKKAEKVTA